ncbi:hypothetical protein TPY_3170 [Sulfobacillus acidophilus TPY]|nr:hypothetical protein TPY_3170 [Sulfobacillus acidophilus TPY]
MMAHVPNMHTTVTPATSGSNPSTSSAPDPTTFNAYFETGWNDPLSLSVGIVWTYMTFSWNGADVNSWTTWGSYQTPIPDEDYFYNISHGGYYGDGYTEATGWMDATEDAPLFANTKIYWEPNAINVGGSGWITGFVNTWTNGPDAWMLHGPWSILNNGTTN